MAKVAGGSVDALGELYDRYSGRAFRVARSVCGDHGAAEDAVQEAFVTIFRTSVSHRSRRGTIAAWLLMIVLERAREIARMESGDAIRRASEGGLRVRGALAALPDAQREAIALACYGGLTHTDIAEQLGVPSGTVKDRIRLGMGELRLSLEPAQ